MLRKENLKYIPQEKTFHKFQPYPGKMQDIIKKPHPLNCHWVSLREGKGIFVMVRFEVV